MITAGAGRIVTEASEHSGHPGILVGTIERTASRRYEAGCERCRRRLESEATEREAEAALRRHRLECRPPIARLPGKRPATPAGERFRATEPARTAGHGEVLAGWVERAASGGATDWTPICERCSNTLPTERSAAEAAAALKRHRNACRPSRVKKGQVDTRR